MRKVGRAVVFAKTTGITREQWLRLRAGGIGGSDIPKIAGVSTWGNQLTTYLDKIDPLRDDGEQSEAAAIGVAVEELVAKLWQERNPGLKLRRVNAILQHPEHPWALANVDRIVLDAKTNEVVGIYEGKSGGIKAPWENDAIPDAYYLQGQWYLGVTGLPRIYYGALLGGYGGMAIATREAAADPELITDLFTIGASFWQLVQDRTPPAIDGSPLSDEVLKHLHPEAHMGEVVELPPQGALLAAALLDAKVAAKVAAEEENRLANELKLLVGDAERATCPGFRLSWTNVTTNRLDGKALKEAHPELHAQFTKPSQSRRFTCAQERDRG
ncbi:MAG: YqaJ viral recombinase family protein [Deferrisomatales bacterium]|nr:YqaJ viral recombinase family protein [Deferrisomatales bacterium]